MNCQGIKMVVDDKPTKSLIAHAKDMCLLTNTISRMVKKEWGEVLRVEEKALAHFCRDSGPSSLLRKTPQQPQGQVSFLVDVVLIPVLANVSSLYFLFWVHMEGVACRLCKPNMEAPKASDNNSWDGMD